MCWTSHLGVNTVFVTIANFKYSQNSGFTLQRGEQESVAIFWLRLLVFEKLIFNGFLFQQFWNFR